MDEAIPGPGEALNPGPPTRPRPAATVILLRDQPDGMQVLLAKRNPAARFMGGAWVFPGGAVGPSDGPGESGLRAAAVRELREETGVSLQDPASMVAFSRWITPAEVRIRFDTWFFLAPSPPGAEPVPDGQEMVDARWFDPPGALAAARAGEILLVFPTIRHLEQLAGFDSASQLIEYARGREIKPVQPVVVGTGETARIVLPDEHERGGR
ncbi:MAG TPA: NUDIX hydrolase [Solirubrobacteraceae bacterium]|nr:NUDIX hydrolase [Solirubrobacteraceae bacterium]